MALQKKRKFSFTVGSMPGDTFSVVSFKGVEGLSMLFQFEIILISANKDIDFDDALHGPATLSILRDGGPLPFHGILARFEVLYQVNDYVFYRAVLMPKAWWLTLTHHNQIFLNQDVQGFTSAVLADGGLAPGIDFSYKLQGAYPTWEYICQYGESHFDFFSRWAERDGLYYYFDHSGGKDTMVITDTHMAHAPFPQGETLRYSPPSGLDSSQSDEVIKQFTLSQTPLPGNVQVQDYNYRLPGLQMKGDAQISSEGAGAIHLYGEHFRSQGEGASLARVRAEEFQCREKLYHGLSNSPYVRSGYTFTLTNHFLTAFNREYLTINIHHEGSQASYLEAGLGVALKKEKGGLFYRNTFTAIPSDTQFRPERKTTPPRFYGALNAKVDGAGSGQYADIDEHGRYKVILPFDLSGRGDGHASTWLRMAQPYAGSNHGMHFPLHKGTEVLLTFINGNPDRPVIASAIPNPETPSVVQAANHSQCAITTGGQNKIHMEDQAGNQRILMHTPSANSFMRLGSPNDPAGEDHDGDGGEGKENEEGIKLYSASGLDIEVAKSNKIVLGEETTHIGGLEAKTVVGADIKTTIGAELTTTIARSHSIKATSESKWTPNILENEQVKEILNEARTEEINSFMRTVESEIATIESAIHSIQDKVETCETKTVTTQEYTATSMSMVVDAQDQVNTIQSKVETVQDSVETVDTKVFDADSVVSDVDTSIQNNETLIENAESKITNAEDCVENSDASVTNSDAIVNNADAVVMNADAIVASGDVVLLGG